MLARKISQVKIRPDAVDEWYGMLVRFAWEVPYTPQEWVTLKEAEYKEEQEFFAKGTRAHVGMFSLEKQFVNEVIDQILNSPELAAFYKEAYEVDVETGPGDERIRTVTLPRFRKEDFDGWGFTAEGGFVGASSRD